MDRLLVGIEGEARLRHALIKPLVEEHDLAGDSGPRQVGEFGKAVYDQNFSSDPIARSGHTQAAKGGDDDLLRRPRYLARIRDQFATVFTPYPPRDPDLFETHVKGKLAQCVGDIVDGR